MHTNRWWVAVGALLPLASLATSIVPHTLLDRARTADRVAFVQVLSRRTIAEENDPRRIKTFTELLVGQDVKGSGAQHLTLVQLGGSWGGWTRSVPGDADFAIGETALVFLKCSGARCWLVAMGEGKVPVVGDQAMVHDLFTGKYARRPLGELVAELRQGLATPLPPLPAQRRTP